MTAKRYPFDGEQMTVQEIMARYPAYSEARVRSALTKMQPPATDRAGLDRWDYESKRRAKEGSRISAALGATQIIVNPKGGFAQTAKRIQEERAEWARKTREKRNNKVRAAK